MPIDNWLNALPQNDHCFVDGDLAALTASHPFLSDQCASSQIERLSDHLGGLKGPVRRKVISYSLYVRQLDIILEAGPRDVCAGNCPRPPVGCCVKNHFVTLSPMDLMSAQHFPLALHMAHVIGQLQKSESAHNLDQGRTIQQGYCQCLAGDGCTLRLFKSPRCAHYLCEGLEQAMQDRHEGQATAFLAAMHFTVSSPISSPDDFMNADCLSEAVPLFGAQLA